jgi:Ribosomal protein L3
MAKTMKGVLGFKLGMTQMWDENNKVVSVTVVHGRTVRRNACSHPGRSTGYNAVQLGFGAI